jgi:hypothetical protein
MDKNRGLIRGKKMKIGPASFKVTPIRTIGMAPDKVEGLEKIIKIVWGPDPVSQV